MPTARIIFKGLCAFLINSAENLAAVLLVNHPNINDLGRPARHDHIPRVRWTGFDDGGDPVVAPWNPLVGSLRFDWGAPPDPPKLDVPDNFHDFVPLLTDLGAGSDTIEDAPDLLTGPEAAALVGMANGFVRAVVVCDAGRLEVSDVVRFWRHRSKQGPPGTRGPKVQQQIRFPGGAVGNPNWAGLATEARVYIDAVAPGASFNLRFTDRPGVSLRPPPPGSCDGPNSVTAACHDIGPDKVEVSISNFSRRLIAPLPYSVHAQWFFNLLSAPVGPDPDLPAQVTAATAAWGPDFKELLAHDLEDLGGAHFPFPVVPNPRDAAGLPIMDEEDRAICPFVGGKD